MTRFIYYVWLLALVAGCAQYRPDRHQQYLATAAYLYDEGEFEDSLEHLQIVEKNQGLSDEHYVLKAKNHMALGNKTQAYLTYHDGLNYRPHSKKLWLELADWHLEHGAQKEAAYIAQSQLKADPQNFAIRKFLARVYISVEQWGLAQVELEKCKQQNYSDEDIGFWLGQVLYKQSKLAEAIPHFDRAYVTGSYQQRSSKYLAWIHAELGNTDKANISIRRLILENPNDHFAQKLMARNLLNIPAVDKVAVLKSYLQKNQDDWGHYHYWLALNEVGLKDQALDHLAGLWNQDPGKAWVAITYAQEFQQRGDRKIASSILEKSLARGLGEEREAIQGQLSVMAQPAPAVKEAPVVERSVATQVRTHLVQPGESLGAISQKYYKRASEWKKIFQLNRHKLVDPEFLSPGTELTIPELAK